MEVVATALVAVSKDAAKRGHEGGASAGEWATAVEVLHMGARMRRTELVTACGGRSGKPDN